MGNEMNENLNDIQVAVFATCDEMLHEEIPTKRITGRKVASRSNVLWSHTTVTPHVNAWHEQRTEREREAIKLTNMSQNFVKALHREVEERVGSLRRIDEEQMQRLQTELQDMVETNAKVENEINAIKQRLAVKTEEASQATALSSQYKQDKLKLEIDHKETIDKLKSNIEENQSKYELERKELKSEHIDAIQKLTEKKDEIHSDLKEKSAECAEARVKGENFEQAALELKLQITENKNLSSENIKLLADIETKQNALNLATQTIIDSNGQRDKAQTSREASELELRELHLAHQALMVKTAVELEAKAGENAKLSGDAIRLTGDLEANQKALALAEQTMADYKTQRDLAQEAKKVAELELKEALVDAAKRS